MIIRALVFFLFASAPAAAADYVLTRPDLPNNQQVIYQRTTGTLIYPNPNDPNFAGYSSFLVGGGTPDRPMDLGQGIMVVSQSTPSINGPYNFGSGQKADLFEISIYALANNKFPAGFVLMPWRDAHGSVHQFTLAQWKAFVSGLTDYDVALRSGQNPTQPIFIP